MGEVGYEIIEHTPPSDIGKISATEIRKIKKMKKYLVTGGAGFIGSALCRKLSENEDAQILVIDKLTYAGNISSLEINKRKNINIEKLIS